MRIITRTALVLLTVALSSEACGQSSQSASPPASPVPASTECWIYKKIYPVTRAAFESQHLTQAQRTEILKWARPSSPAQKKLVKAASPWATPPSVSELGLVRWMRNGSDRSIFVFVDRPVFTKGRLGIRPWLALNANVWINPVNCETGAYPAA